MNSLNKKLLAFLVVMLVILGIDIIFLSQVINKDSAPQYTPAIVNGQATTQSAGTNTLVGNDTQGNTVSPENTTAQQQTPAGQPTQQGAAPSAMTNQQILDLLTDSVNKTKAYSGSLTVQHSESFDANVTECTGGSLVAKVVNSLMGMVVKPTDETLSFSGGTAVNSEGETVTILLPQKGNFRLQMSGISAISAYADGANTVVSVTLVPEAVGMYETPTANAAGVGFLDVASLDLSFIEVTKADIQYRGSTIKAVINPNGYVTYAEYTIPLHVEGAAGIGPINGSAVFDGMQTEIWSLEL